MADENTETLEKPTSVRETLAAAIDAVEKPETVKVAIEGTEKAGGRPRDETGRYLPKTDEVAAAEKKEPTEAAPPASTTTAEAAVIPPAATSAVEPPQHWSQADKESFKSAPPEIKEWLMGRYKSMEGDYTRRVQRVANLEREYTPVEELFRPYEAQLAQRGLTKSGLIQAWANAEIALNRNPVGALVHIARSYGVTPETLVQALQNPQNEQTKLAAADPNLLLQVQQMVQPLQQQIETMRREREEGAIQATLENINDFADEKDASGKPAHPHFDEVAEDMSIRADALRRIGKPIVLQELYEQAVYANPTTRAKQLALQTQAAAAAALSNGKAKSVAARKAGSSVTGTATAGQTQGTKVPTGTVGQTLRAVVDQFDGARI